jgi:UDP-galactopyranose mutase
LFALSDVVFTGGYSLYEAQEGPASERPSLPLERRPQHFAQARAAGSEPEDIAALPRPRFGFYGVIDERMDLELIAALADAHPEWSIVMVGPVVKIDPADLPQRANIHYCRRQEI